MSKFKRHVSWGAGDPECPKELKAANGELHTLRCKVCGARIDDLLSRLSRVGDE